MLIIYGSALCVDCRNCKNNFDKFGIEYEERDILSSLKNLKSFLMYRDNRHEIFDRLIKIHDIGIPCIVDSQTDECFTDWESYLLKLGYKDLVYEQNAKACSLDHKGC
ncbi:MAG: hypothetical protein K6G28_05335 [Acholeplasmatales bacterium]|nr:hypothetical protein [Acholeplasmatales bacterium]